MKHYFIKLLTQKGPKEVIYSDGEDLEQFTNMIVEKYGTFITLSSDQFEHPLISKIYHLQVNTEIEIKPFMITYNIYRMKEDKFEITRTDSEILNAYANLKELMIAIRDNKFSELTWVTR